MVELFDRIVAAGEAGLQKMIADQQQESVHLDFKNKSDPNHGNMNDDDKRYLGEALSGFANSDGGVLIWGVDARKNADGVDCAQSLRPIANVGAFQSKVQSLIGEYIVPIHDGVQTGVIPCAAQPAFGYLVLGVDRSERRPHRSEAKGKRGYYKRSGDSFYEMEHYDIEDAFNRLHVPSLKIEYNMDKRMLYGHDGSAGYDGRILIYLRNMSSKSAKYPYLHLTPVGPTVTFHPPKNNGNIDRSIQGSWQTFSGGSNAVINPDTKMEMAAIEYGIRKIQPTSAAALEGDTGSYSVNNIPIDKICWEFGYRFGCEDSRMKEGVIKIPGANIIAKFGKF